MSTMDSCRQAIARVRSLLVPQTRFASGTRIYESADPKKQQIQSFASETAAAFEGGRSPTHAELALLEDKLDEYRAHFDSQVDDRGNNIPADSPRFRAYRQPN